MPSLDHRRRHPKKLGLTLGLTTGVIVLLGGSITTLAATDPGLGTAAAYAVLAGTPSVTSTGPTGVSGSIGIAPAASVVGFPPGLVSNGTIERATTAAAGAKADLTTAYGVAAASPCSTDRSNVNLGGLTLTPGTYCQTTAPTLTGTLTLSGSGIYIFQIGSTLVTAPGATVLLTNGAEACNVFWQVSSSATIDTTTTFVGTIMALTDITVNNGAAITGRALAQNGRVTMINDQIQVPAACTTAAAASATPAPTPRPRTTPPTPHAGAVAPDGAMGGILVVTGGGLAFVGWRGRTRRPHRLANARRGSRPPV